MIEHTVYSEHLNGERLVWVWLPAGYNSAQPHQVWYVVGGVIDEVIAAQVNFYAAQWHDRIPASIVVGVYFNGITDVADLGLHYDTGIVNQRGQEFRHYISEELPLFLSENYNTSGSKILLGQSYCGNYVDYIFRTIPNAFDRYAVLAPEKIGDYTHLHRQPEGAPDYFLGIAGRDEERRIAFAKSGISFPQPENMLIREFAEATHMSVTLHAMPAVMEFLYRDYQQLRHIREDYQLTPENICEVLKEIIAVNTVKFGTGIRMNASTVMHLLNIVVAANDLKLLVEVTTIIMQHYPDANALEIVGNYTLKAGDANTALAYYKMAITAYHREGIIYQAENVYRELVRLYISEKLSVQEAWEFAEEGLKYTRRPLFYLLMGELAAVSKYRVSPGIYYLTKFLSEHESTARPDDIIAANLWLKMCRDHLHDYTNADQHL